MLTISTFNIQNKEDKNKIKFIKDYLIDNNIDILNLQEAYPKFMREFQSDLNDYKVTGNGCPRGAVYGKKECTHPTRVVTSTVKIVGAEIERLSVN